MSIASKVSLLGKPGKGITRDSFLSGAIATVAMAMAPGIARAQSDPWKIGVLYPLSGNLSVLGTEALAGAQVAADMVNEQGGVNGRKVELVVADATSPANATNEARRLVTREGVKLMAGTYGSSIALAIAAVGNQFKVPYWEGAAAADEVTGRGYRYVFRLNDTASTLAGALVLAVRELFAPKIGREIKALKIAMIHEDSAFGTSIAKDFVAQVEAEGGKVAIVEPYAANSQDLSSLVLRLKSAAPDVLVATQYFNDAILFWRQSRDNGYNPKYFAAIGSGQATPDFQKGVGKDAEGVLMADVPAGGVRPDALLPAARVLQDEFFKRYQAKLGKLPASHATRNFSAMHVLLTRVLASAGSLDAEAIRKAVMALDEPIGTTILGYGLKFAENGQNERAFNVILQWQDGKIVTVWPERFATAKPLAIPLPDWSERR